MPRTGADLLQLAETRLGEKYVNVLVPKDNPHWHGPWDCAEFVSWVVYQTVQKLYGCVNDHGNPAATEAYSGAWVRDATNGTLLITDQATANSMAGVILIRKPPLPGTMGHVAITDGKGGTVEAAGQGLGVRRGKVEGRQWHYCVQIPGVTYSTTGVIIPPKPLPFLLTLEEANVKSGLVGKVQFALKDKGFSPGVLDNEYGPHTVEAVTAFQTLNRLVADGAVGPLTAKKLEVEWPASEEALAASPAEITLQGAAGDKVSVSVLVKSASSAFITSREDSATSAIAIKSSTKFYEAGAVPSRIHFWFDLHGRPWEIKFEALVNEQRKTFNLKNADLGWPDILLPAADSVHLIVVTTVLDQHA